MYSVSESVKENIVKNFIKVLEEREYPYTEMAVRKIIDTAIASKASLLDILSKHPNWREDKLIIRFEEDYSREFNIAAMYEFANWIIRAIRRTGRMTSNLDDRVIAFIKYSITNQFFDVGMKQDIDSLNALNDNFKLRTNMKASKAILKLCKVMGYDTLPHAGELHSSTKDRPKYDDFNYEYAKLCDNINPIKTKRHTCISLNPLDFLLMSHGSSWHSCHDIDYFNDDPGCYSSGTISYLLDECSFIFYTVDAGFNGNDIEFEPKIQRQVFGYKDEVFIQSRLYPQSMDCGAESVYTDIREVVQKVIADCLDKPNLWVKNTTDVNTVVTRGADATCYPDWKPGCPGSSHCNLSVIKGVTKFPKIVLGARPICIECGMRHSVTGNINCCSSNCYNCENCGCNIEEDEVRWVGDYAYCEDCVTWCEDCEEYELNDDIVRINYIGSWGSDHRYVCSCCAENYWCCDNCGEYWDDDDLVHTEEGNHYCPDCNDSYGYCENCCCHYDSDSMVFDDVDGCYYCDECYDKIVSDRENEEDEEEDYLAG